MRVYELAKKLGMESRELIPLLVRLGIKVASHSNTLDKATAQRALQALKERKSGSSAGKPERGKRKETGELGLQKKSVARDAHVREVTRSTSRLSSALSTEEVHKPEQKHILVKRKKVEEESPLEPVQSDVLAEEATPLPEFSDSQPASVSISEPVQPPSLSPASLHPTAQLSPSVPQAAETSATEAVLPPPSFEEVQPAVLSEIPPAAAEEERPPIHVKKKEGEAVSAKDEVGEKPKKTRKPGRLRDEDIFAEKYEDAARWQDLRPLPTLRREERSRQSQPMSVGQVTKPRKKGIKLTPGITVKEFAELLGQRPAEIIRKLMDVGLPLTLNQPMNLDAGVLIAEGFGVHVEVSVEKEGEALLEEVLESVEEELLVPRAPVVTIMGHVDHGKTSLLDAIRQSKVTDQEAGGITQHIGAYTVSVDGKQVTFLDTPGHKAFTAMRARGAKATDIVVLVVAADDGVMPQTVEACHHAQAANVPIIVAVNKIDKAGANPDRVKQGLTEHGLIPESWGGQTIFVEVSAKQKMGLDTLLEMILLQAEVLELKADIQHSAKGIVLEAKLDRGRGSVATVLVQSGMLHVGDAFVVGTTSGRVRALLSDVGKKVVEAGPSTPVEVIGLLGVPAAGDRFVVMKDERAAREVAEARLHKQRSAELAVGGARLTLDDLYAEGKEGEVKELSLVLKADVQGSVGALCEAVEKLSSSAVKLRVIHSGAGGITESDVLLASASGAIIVGFHVRPEPKASALAEREGVEIRLYTVIYNAIADIKAAAEGLLEPTLKERILGRAEVRQLFTVPKIGTIAGCYVSDGLISRASEGLRVLRDYVTVYEGKVGSLRRFKDDVREVQHGYECGIGIENFNDLKVGDVIEAYVFEREAAKL